MPFAERLFSRRNKPPHASSPQDSGESYLIDEKQPSPIAIIYKSELDYLSRCVLDYPNIETGGQLFGFWTNQGVPVVMYVIGPGRNANHQPTFFNQDTEYLTTVGNALLDKFGLCHIGEWHSHHQLGLARPSGHDARTMHNGLIRIPQRRLLLCICNYERGMSTVNPFNFHENNLQGYADAKWQVIDMESPFRPIADRQLASLLIHPRTAEARHGSNSVFEEQPEPPKSRMIKIPKDYWVSRPGNLQTLKQMLELTQTMFNGMSVNTQADENGIVQFVIPDRSIAIRFGKDFPALAPGMFLRGTEVQPNVQWVQPANDSCIFFEYAQWVRQLFSTFAQTPPSEQ